MPSAGPLSTDQRAAVDNQELLGKAGVGGLPVWLDPEKFLIPDFNSEAAVADLRRFVPLATLQTELHNYLATLKSKLVEVINEDYSDYVSLSSKLVNVDGAVVRMRKPLVELKDKLTVMQEAVKGELSALNQGLKRRKEVATARSLLELLQELAHVASKVEKLLVEVASAPSPVDGPGATADLDAHSRLLERVAAEFSRLSFQAARGKDLAFVKAMEPRISAARKELEGRLAAALSAALQTRAHSAALHCLSAYAELGEPGPAEAEFRRVVVAPCVERAISEHKQAHPRSAAGEGLSQLLAAILSAITSEAGQLLTASLAPASPLRVFDFLGNSVLAEVQEALAATMPGVFSPGVPAMFHANYLAAMKLLDDLEAMCQGRAAAERLRASAAYGAFLRRWNLSVYFSLLYQDIAGSLEDALTMDRLELLPAPSRSSGGGAAPAPLPPVQLPPSSALLQCLQRVASPQVFLLHIADRFMKLALQLGTRYAKWAGAVVAARRDAAAGAAAAAAAAAGPMATPQVPGVQQQQAAAPLAGSGGSVPLPGSVTGSSGGAQQPPDAAGAAASAAGGSLAWVAQLPAEDLCIIYQDVHAVAQYLGDQLVQQLCELTAPLPAETVQAAKACLQGQGAAIEAQAQALLGCIADEVVDRCVAVVRQLKGITATYRMTTKGPPTRHSHYVTGVLGPLKVLLDSERVLQMRSRDKDAAQALAGRVVDAVSVRYQQLADELMTTVRKTESSLKRLKKNKAEAAGGEAGEGAGMSDSDKICLQLYLDVQEYGNQVSKFGLQPTEMQSFQRLVESVQPSSSTAATSQLL